MIQAATKAYLIDPFHRTVTEVEHTGLDSMQKLIGGYGEVACAYPDRNGDILYVDEEGLLKPGQRYFYLRERPDQALAGRGLLVGPERDLPGGGFVIDPPRMTRADLMARVSFPP